MMKWYSAMVDLSIYNKNTTQAYDYVLKLERLQNEFLKPLHAE